MELMSSLLLCAVVALSPQASGEREIKYAEYASTRSNILPDFRINPSFQNTETKDFQSIFKDDVCKDCKECMERTMNLLNPPSLENKPITKDFGDDILITYNVDLPRDKRESDDVVDVTVAENFTIKPKRTKAKKSHLNKSVTVSKYNVDGEITALKVKEMNTLLADPSSDIQSSSTCQVYKVKKSYPCNTPEGDAILAAVKRKVKKSKKVKYVNTVTTNSPKLTAPAFKKREVDNSQIQENFMPSIEELY